MNPQIPTDMLPFIEEMVAKRRFLTEGDVVREGLRLLQSREILREEVAKGFDQLDRGQKLDAKETRQRAVQAIAGIQTSKE